MAGPPMFKRVIARSTLIGGDDGTRPFSAIGARPVILSAGEFNEAMMGRGLSPVLLPWGLLVIGASVGYRFTLDEAVARERWLGLVVAGVLAIGAMVWLQRVERPAAVLVCASTAALLSGLWVIAATGSDVFRGLVGRGLQWLFAPLFGLAQVTDPVEVANTRFIVGYNGLADLCVVAIFCCAAVVLERRRFRSASGLGLLTAIGISGLLLVGAGARGGLTGLAAGVCAIGLVAWPRRFALLALIGAPVAFAIAAIGFLDKGLEFSSTAGRLAYWADLARLLTEYPLTGVGLGVDTAFKATLLYEINPDPERVFYAHDTFVQSYLETGPLGMLGMLLVPLVALAAALVARQRGFATERRPLLLAGLGIVGALSVHGLTDQVVTTNVGTAILLVGLAAVLAALSPTALRVLSGWVRSAAVGLAVLFFVAIVACVALPAGRAQMLLDLGSLKLNQALALDAQAPDRAAALADAENTLSGALTQASEHPALLRELARARAARYDDAGALDALNKASRRPGLDPFDTLQIAHLYRDFGFAEQAYTLASRAYTVWGRSTEDAVMQTYAQSTLAVLDDYRARTLTDQAEAAMRARAFGEAVSLFQQALTFEPNSAYIQDRLGAAQRAVAKYGP
jgi:hypothetical protein